MTSGATRKSNNYISNSQAEESGGCTRILKFNDTEIPINEQSVVAVSNFLKRLFAEEKGTVIALDDLKKKYLYFDLVGLTNAVAFANNGNVNIPVDEIVNALAAAKALEMWNFWEAIIEQLRMLATKPKSAPFAINVAVCYLEYKYAKKVMKQSFGCFDELIKQRSFPAINFISFQYFISLYIHKHSTTNRKEDMEAVMKSVIQAINSWCGDDKKRLILLETTLKKLGHFWKINIIDHVQRSVIANAEKNWTNYTGDDENTFKIKVGQSNVGRAIAGGSETSSNKSLIYESVHQIELPAVEPDAEGIRHYSFVVEFETPKEFLFSDKPKLIALQLEAIVENTNQ